MSLWAEALCCSYDVLHTSCCGACIRAADSAVRWRHANEMRTMTTSVTEFIACHKQNKQSPICFLSFDGDKQGTLSVRNLHQIPDVCQCRETGNNLLYVSLVKRTTHLSGSRTSKPTPLLNCCLLSLS